MELYIAFYIGKEKNVGILSGGGSQIIGPFAN